MNEHVLLLSPFYFPEPIGAGRYNAHLAEYLRDAGSSVSVACSHPVYPEWSVHRTQEELPRVTAHRGGGFIRYPRGTLMRRLVLESWFTLHAMQVALSLRSRVDFVVAVFPPSLFWTLTVMLVPGRVPTLGIVHDLQATYAQRMPSRFARWVRAAVHHVERRAFNRCDKLVFMSHAMRDIALREYGLPPHKCIVAYPPATVRDTGATPEGPPALRDTSVRHVVYSGALGVKQNPRALLALLEDLARVRADVRCHVFSRGPVFEALRKSAAETGLVQFHDLVADEELAGMYERSAVQIVSEEPGASQGSLPSKLANILWMGVPVFCITDPSSELAQLVGDSGIGVTDSSFSHEHQLHALQDLLDRSESWDRGENKARIRAELADRFSFARILGALRA
ncbi:MAG: glycosyltransferase [Ramlibacter sp.]